MRVTQEILENIVEDINRCLMRPTNYFSNEITCETNVGHIHLEKWSGNYQLQVLTNTKGASEDLSGVMTGKEAKLFLDGIVCVLNIKQDRQPISIMIDDLEYKHVDI